MTTTQDNKWFLDGKELTSRLLLGTAGYPSLTVLREALIASGTQIATVGIRRIDLDERHSGILSLLKELDLKILPNTAGCYTAKEAIFTAHMAREALSTSWIKLEVIGDSYSLFPDNEELLVAARQLIQEGFQVFPYCNDDPVLCRKLEDMGCRAVMPLGAPIGSGQGIRNPHNLELICRNAKGPVIVDAGVGTASHVCQALELGATAVLLNTAIAGAMDPPLMAKAMRRAAEAGISAFNAGRIPEKKFATPSTPDRGRLEMRKM